MNNNFERRWEAGRTPAIPGSKETKPSWRFTCLGSSAFLLNPGPLHSTSGDCLIWITVIRFNVFGNRKTGLAISGVFIEKRTAKQEGSDQFVNAKPYLCSLYRTTVWTDAKTNAMQDIPCDCRAKFPASSRSKLGGISARRNRSHPLCLQRKAPSFYSLHASPSGNAQRYNVECPLSSRRGILTDCAFRPRHAKLKRINH